MRSKANTINNISYPYWMLYTCQRLFSIFDQLLSSRSATNIPYMKEAGKETSVAECHLNGHLRCAFKKYFFKTPWWKSWITSLAFLFQTFCSHQKQKGKSERKKEAEINMPTASTGPPLTSRLSTEVIKLEREWVPHYNKCCDEEKRSFSCFRI